MVFFLYCSICPPYVEIKKMWNTSLVPIQWVKPHDATKGRSFCVLNKKTPPPKKKKNTSQTLRRSRAVIHLVGPGGLKGQLQIGGAAVGRCADIRLQDGPDRKVHWVQVRAGGWPHVLVAEVSHVGPAPLLGHFVVVVVGPPGRYATGAEPRLRRAISPEGLHVAGEGCGQGRDVVRVSHRLWRRVDGAQEAKAGPRQARAPQKDVPWRVRLLSADYAAGGWAVPRAASGTGWFRFVSFRLFRAFPHVAFTAQSIYKSTHVYR